MSETQRDGSEMRCKRCGANECRIHGFCSVECEHYFDYEEEITDLEARIAELEEQARMLLYEKRRAVLDAIGYRDKYECLKKRCLEIDEAYEKIRELQKENERLEEAYFIDETIAPDGSLKPSVRKLLERLEKAETDLGLSAGLIDSLIDRIAELEAERRWIPVSEPPTAYRDETGELIPFLACENDKDYPFRAIYDGKKWGDGMFVAEVTHWMPLPEPPEESEK